MAEGQLPLAALLLLGLVQPVTADTGEFVCVCVCVCVCACVCVCVCVGVCV